MDYTGFVSENADSSLRAAYLGSIVISSIFLLALVFLLHKGLSMSVSAKGREFANRNTGFLFLFTGVFTFLIAVSGYSQSAIHPSDGTVGIVFVCLMIALMIYIFNLVRDLRSIQNSLTYRNNRRFYLPVTSGGKSGNVLMVSGLVRGTVRMKDAVYILYDHDRYCTGRVIRLAENGKPVHECRDRKITMSIRMDQDMEMSPNLVVTSIIPQSTYSMETDAETPYLQGLIAGSYDHTPDAETKEIIIESVLQSKFIVPVKIRRRFDHSIYSFPFITRVDGKQKTLIAGIFTDRDSMERWQAHNPQFRHSEYLLMTFKQAAVLMDRGYEGIVINPFSRESFYLSKNSVHELSETDAYKNSFPEEPEDLPFL